MPPKKRKTGRTNSGKAIRGHSTNLLDLPLEVLRFIVDEIADTKTSEAYPNIRFVTRDEKERKLVREQTIRSLRLVNKRLHEAATPALIPNLFISLDDKSLEKAERITSNALIASGIRTIQLSVKYCPHHVAKTMDSFKTFKLRELQMLFSHCHSELQMAIFSARILPPQRQESRKDYIGMWERVYCKWLNVRVAWGIPSDDPDDPDDPDNLDDAIDRTQHPEFQQLLEDGFAQFQALHQQQDRLISTGEFATAISRIAAKMPRFQSLSISDRPLEAFGRKDLDAKEGRIFLDNSKMLEVLSSPLNWSDSLTYEDNTNGFDPPYKATCALLCDVPIALARNNIHVREFRLECVPFLGNMDLLVQENCPLQGTEEELRRAMSMLQTFRFSPPFSGYLGHQTRDEIHSREHLLAYLAQCVSSKHLETMTLDLELYSWLDGHETVHHINLEHVFGSMSSVSLKKLSIDSASMPLSTMQQLCLRFKDNIEVFRLYNVVLSDGSWADALDSIRSAAMSRFKTGNATSLIEHITDNTITNYHVRLFGSECLETIILHKHMSVEGDCDAACDYISGEIGENPLRKYDEIW